MKNGVVKKCVDRILADPEQHKDFLRQMLEDNFKEWKKEDLEAAFLR